MIKSMTAFGRGIAEGADKDFTVEIKSVNSRYFDCSVKMPRAFSFLEEKVKAYIQKNAVSRAKVDCYISVDFHSGASGTVDVDFAYAESYIEALRALSDRFGLTDDITVCSVARNQDIFLSRKTESDAEEDWAQLKSALDIAIGGYCEMRTAEGARIESDLKGKLSSVSEMVDRIEALSKTDTVGYRDKLETRLRQILSDNAVSVDENRLLTECAVWADKIAIDEELVRLRAHFRAFEEIASVKEPSGRKLDFLMQEMNRETNTIGSKCNNSSIARIVVDIKGELEKVREQVQNIE